MKKIILTLAASFLFPIISSSFISCSSGGEDGVGITWKGSLNAAPENPGYLWAYYDTNKQCSYVWNGSAWVLFAGSEKKTFDVTLFKSEEITTKNVSFRIEKDGEIKNDGSDLSLIFKTNLPQLPYIPCTAAMLKDLLNINYSVSSINADSQTVTITSPDGYTALFDLTKRTCTFSNYDAFFQDTVGDKNIYTNPPGNLHDHGRVTDYANIAGQKITIDWSSQNLDIGIAPYKGEYALTMPLQTFNDFFDSTCIYNGKYIYYTFQLRENLSQYDSLREEYYSTAVTTNQLSQEFADYRYNELCMNLDINYGLKELHGINNFPDFDTYFATVGIKNNLKSTSPSIFAQALKDVCEFYFDDGHSNYILNSYYLGKDTVVNTSCTSITEKAYEEEVKKYTAARNAVYSNKNWTDETNTRRCSPGFELSSDGKTAIVRFDRFTKSEKVAAKLIEDRTALLENTNEKLNDYAGYYESKYDTLSFLSSVNQLIKANSNIENVVLDLSRNSGGALHAAIATVSWMLGEATLNISNPITGAKWYATYQIDIDLNGSYDSGDNISDKKLFCLISPVSFSCGTMVPAMLKASDNVTILGVTSGGGTAIVHYTSAADGSIFNCSSKYLFSLAKNGSNYDIDSGVEPHYHINQPANFYDKDKLSSLVQNINNAKL